MSAVKQNCVFFTNVVNVAKNNVTFFSQFA